MIMNTDIKFQALSNLIGNTPLLEIELLYKGKLRKIYAKAEYYNLTGSIKDRIAYYILKDAYKKGLIREGGTITEATSGNTGISFSAIGKYLGNRVIIYMPEWMSTERKILMKSYGAEIRLISRDEGGFRGCVARAREFAESEPNIFFPDQFSNPMNTKAHSVSTGPEIVSQLKSIGRTADAVVAGVGTGGTLCGIGNYLREINPKIRVYPLEPASSPTLSTGGSSGEHRIQGISDEFIPDIIKENRTDDIISVEDGDAILMAQNLASQLGLGVGISSGANLLGALKVQDMLGEDSTVVTVFSDDCKKYLSTDYAGEEPVKPSYLTPQVKLVSFRGIK
jgi:cysteine synthase A